MYPPQDDSLREVPGHSAVRRLRSRMHNTFIGANGAIEIQTTSSPPQVVLVRSGANGRGVWEQ